MAGDFNMSIPIPDDADVTTLLDAVRHKFGQINRGTEEAPDMQDMTPAECKAATRSWTINEYRKWVREYKKQQRQEALAPDVDEITIG